MLEKTIAALQLLGHLAESGLPIQFKGGSSLLLRLNPIRRLSIDVDIVTQAKAEELIAVLKRVSHLMPLAGYTHDAQRDKELPPKKHFRIFYPSDVKANNDHVLVPSTAHSDRRFDAGLKLQGVMGFVQLGAQALARQFDHQAESIRWPRPVEPREANFGRGTFQGHSLAKRPKIGLRPACAYQLRVVLPVFSQGSIEPVDVFHRIPWSRPVASH